MTLFIIGLPYDHLHPSCSQQFVYKNFGCWATANKYMCTLHTAYMIISGSYYPTTAGSKNLDYHVRQPTQILIISDFMATAQK